MGWWKILKNVAFSQTLSDHHYSHESLHSGSLWQSLSGHASSCDLHPRSQELIETLGIVQHWHFLVHCHHCSHESWQDGIPWQDVSEHTNIGDLYPGSRSRGQIDILENTVNGIFSDTMTTTVYQTIQSGWPSAKVKVIQSGWPSVKVISANWQSWKLWISLHNISIVSQDKGAWDLQVNLFVMLYATREPYWLCHTSLFFFVHENILSLKTLPQIGISI